MGRLRRAWALVLSVHITTPWADATGHFHHGHHHQGADEPRDQHRHLRSAEGVQGLRLTLLDPIVEPTRKLEASEDSTESPSLHTPYGRRLKVEFRAFETDHAFHLTLNRHLYAESAVLRTVDDDGSEVVEPLEAVAYAGEIPGGGWVRATVHDDDVVQAVWYEGGEIKMLTPLKKYRESSSAWEVTAPHRANGARMLAYRLRDMDLDEHAHHLLHRYLVDDGGDDRPEIHPIASEVSQHKSGAQTDGPGPHGGAEDKGSGGGSSLSTEAAVGEYEKEGDTSTVEGQAGREGVIGLEGDHTGRRLGAQMATSLKRTMMNTKQPYGVMSGCPSTMFKVALGFAADAGYTAAITGYKAGGSMTAATAVSEVSKDLQAQINIVNMLYADMANVFLSIAEVYIRTAAGTEAWNQQPLDASVMTGANRYTFGCAASRAVRSGDNDYTTTLQNFGAWRNSLSSTRKYAGWQLLTDCYSPPGTVGLAYIGSTCNTAAYGVSWASYQDEATWLTIAHELGHNFGAYHTMSTGGIMSYDTAAAKEIKFSGTNPSELCSHISAVKGVCYSAFSSTCGNGILEPGEECDDSTPCCDRTRGCKLAHGATCTYGLESQCCTTTCNYRPTTTACQVDGGAGKGYCYNGVCHPSKLAMTYSNLLGCAAPTSNPCKEYVVYGGSCAYTADSFQLTGYTMPDGAFCNSALNRICTSGSCVYTPTPAPVHIPTKSPTRGPTVPTKRPSPRPTPRPTKVVTKPPSKRPTRTPTRVPTAPTRRPTRRPTPRAAARIIRGLQSEAANPLVVGSPVPSVATSNASLTITHPSAGETLYNGAIALIQWTSTIDIAYVSATLSDGTVITNKQSATSLYWRVDAEPDKRYSIGVVGYPAIPTYDDSGDDQVLLATSQTFVIQDPDRIVVTKPSHRDVIEMGTPTLIQWDTRGTITKVHLSIVTTPVDLTTGNSSVKLDLGWVDNSGSLQWVPPTVHTGRLRRGKYAVMVEYSPSTQATRYALGGLFTLKAPSSHHIPVLNMSFVYPEPGQTLVLGQELTVYWQSPPFIRSVGLYLTQPVVGTQVLIWSGPNLNSYTWNVGRTQLQPNETIITPAVGYELMLLDTTEYNTSTADMTWSWNTTSGALIIIAPQPSVTVKDIFEGQMGMMWRRGKPATIYFSTSDPADTVSLELFDSTTNQVTYTITTQAASSTSPYLFHVPYTVPPSDCYSCYLLARSNRYPGVYHAYAAPFSISSSDHSDIVSERVATALALTFPSSDAKLIRGRQYNVSWDAIMVRAVSIMLTNLTCGKTNPLALSLENTATWSWTLPSSPSIVGTYDIYLTDDFSTMATSKNRFYIIDPPAKPPAVTILSPTTTAVWTEGDTVSVEYTSEGIQDSINVSLQDAYGMTLESLSSTAPTAGTLTFTVPASPSDATPQVFICVSGPGAAPVTVGPFLVLNRRALSALTLPTPTLAKGKTYDITWQSAGMPFGVQLLLYKGSPKRKTVSGVPCAPWYVDLKHVNRTGCIMSYDLVSEVCATAVDSEGYWLEGGQCADASTTFQLITSYGPYISIKQTARITLPAGSTDLPIPGTDYTLILTATAPGVQVQTSSGMFTVASPTVSLLFAVVPRNASERDTSDLAGPLTSYLSTATGIDGSRIQLNLTQPSDAHNSNDTSNDTSTTPYIDVAAVLLSSTNVLDISAYDAAYAFRDAWANGGSTLYPAYSQLPFTLDPTVEPTIDVWGEEDGFATVTSPMFHRGRAAVEVVRRGADALYDDGDGGAKDDNSENAEDVGVGKGMGAKEKWWEEERVHEEDTLSHRRLQAAADSTTGGTDTGADTVERDNNPAHGRTERRRNTGSRGGPVDVGGHVASVVQEASEGVSPPAAAAVSGSAMDKGAERAEGGDRSVAAEVTMAAVVGAALLAVIGFYAVRRVSRRKESYART